MDLRSTRGPRLGWAVLGGVLAGWAGNARAQTPDAGADPGLPEAGVVVTATRAAARRPAPTLITNVDPLSPEAMEALRLHRLGDHAGKKIDVPLESLFPVDLRDEAAVQARLRVVDRLLRLSPSPRLVGTASTSTVGLQPAQVMDSVERNALLAERAILRLDRDTRLSRLDADVARRAHEREKEEANARAKAAEAAAKEAEQARLKALEEAERAKTEAIKALKSRLATVAQAKSQLADRSQRFSEFEESQSNANAEAFERVQALLQRETDVGDGPAAYALFGEIRAELATSIVQLRQALKKPDRGFAVPDLRADIKFARPGASDEERAASDELKVALAEFDAYLADVRATEKAFRPQSINAAYTRVQALAGARVRLLRRLPTEARLELEGISLEGFEEARFEAELLTLGARAQPILHADKVQHVPSYLKDALTLGKTFWVLTKIIFVIIMALWLRRRGHTLEVWGDRVVRANVRSVIWMRRYAFFKRNVEAYGPYLLFLLSIHLIYWSLGTFGEAVEIDLLFTTVLWVSYYWLLRTWLDATIHWLAKKRRVVLDKELDRRLRRSTTLIARTVLTFGLLQSVAVRILRRGVLFHFADILLWAGAVMVGLIVVRWWRRSIASAYLNKWPEGTLAQLVQSTQDKFYNIFVVMAALGFVLVSGVVTFGRQFVLGFEQSRKALAFVFRKRLERRSEKMGVWGSSLEALPPRLVAAFRLDALEDQALRMEFFPGLEKFLRDVSTWQKNSSKGSFALIASEGYGKSTWVHRALASVTSPTEYIKLERRDATSEALLAQLRPRLQLPPEATYEDIVAKLKQVKPQVWALDDAHNLFFRTMEGCAALDVLMALIEHTGQNIFWLCTFNRHAWRHILSHRPTRIRFRAEQILDDWPEDKLRELLMMRAGASGVSHEFEDLVVAGESDRATALLEASEGYTRLIWDYSDGCPRVALRFWLHSLVPIGPDTVRVRLFKQPDEGSFSNIPEEALFVYAAVANHGALTCEQAAQIVGYPLGICESALVRGVEAGYLADTEGRYLLAVDWQRQMIRFLRARQAL